MELKSNDSPAPATDLIVSVGAIFVASFVLFALVSVVSGVPVPKVHDEFSYLLAADTFAHGRFTNPTHPLWPHFETFHVFHVPSYQSKYPPAQGLALAVGQIAGHPILGVWLSSSAAIAALLWCLSRWMPLPWAVIGAAITALHPLFLRWTQCYWGGMLGMLGGALVIGAIRQKARYDLAIAAIGALILANSRPFEGLVLCLIAVPFFRRRTGRLLAVLILLAGFSAMGLYNDRVTGSPFRLPYLVHKEQYMAGPLFKFQAGPPLPEYRHEVFRQFHTGWELQHTPEYVKFLRLARAAFRLSMPAMDGEKFPVPFPPIGLSIVFLVPIAGAFLAARQDRWIRIALLMLFVFMIALVLPNWVYPHYAAPAAPLLAIVLTAGLRRAVQWRIAFSVFLVGWIASFAIAAWVLKVGQKGAGSWLPAAHRARMQQELQGTGQKHLVVVRRSPRATLHFEYVANGADIDAAPVVWAHEMNDNRQLVNYYKDRTIWLLDTSVEPPRLIRPRG